MKLSTTQKNAFKAAADHYHQSVTLAHTYLAGRGLWDEELVATFLLGVVEEPLPEHESFVGRLCIPYLTPYGVVNLKFRCIEDHECGELENHAKYLGLPGAQDRVYNVQALHDADDIIYLTEGELDALAATVAGFPAVGISGANKWRPHYGKLLEDYREVVALVDGDRAGRNFAKVIRDGAIDQDTGVRIGGLRNARIVYMPDGEDVNSFLVKNAIEDFQALIDG